MYEVAVLQGLDPNGFNWGFGEEFSSPNRLKNTTLLRDILGEPVPPMFTKTIADNLCAICIGKAKEKHVEAEQLALF